MTNDSLLTVAARAARAGGAVLRSALGERRAIQWKADETGERSIVTDADVQADRAIQRVILAALPEHAILSEEGQPPPPDATDLWVIDPLDGTDEFSRGSPSCCVAVAYLHRGATLAAAVYDPFRDELFTAARGVGAWLNGRAITVSTVDTVADAVVAFSSPDRRRSQAAFDETVRVLDRLVQAARQVRVYGSTALEICWVANGRLEAKVSLRGRAWDFLAPALVLTEAGGACYDLDGAPLTLATIGAIASNGPLQADLAALVSAR